MLASWMNLMPLFVVRWMALRYCERVHVGGLLYVIARRRRAGARETSAGTKPPTSPMSNCEADMYPYMATTDATGNGLCELHGDIVTTTTTWMQPLSTLKTLNDALTAKTD
jgi:hypothetical protein